MIVNFAHLLTILDKIDDHEADVEIEIGDERYKITRISIEINQNIEGRNRIVFRGEKVL